MNDQTNLRSIDVDNIRMKRHTEDECLYICDFVCDSNNLLRKFPKRDDVTVVNDSSVGKD